MLTIVLIFHPPPLNMQALKHIVISMNIRKKQQAMKELSYKEALLIKLIT